MEGSDARDDERGEEDDPLYIKILLRMLTGVDVNTRALPHPISEVLGSLVDRQSMRDGFCHR
jgi:hypothetical protein